MPGADSGKGQGSTSVPTLETDVDIDCRMMSTTDVREWSNSATQSRRLRVVMLAEDGPMRRSLERYFNASSLDVELVQTMSELESRAIRGERSAPEMIVLLLSPRGAVASRGVAALVARASSLIRKPAAATSWPSATTPDEGQGARLASLVSTYASQRAFSPQQEKVLRLYLDGKNDKEIAELCACATATIYEHWRRMAKKGGALHKADVIADFHRFLGHD